jgi:hypothetical protein
MTRWTSRFLLLLVGLLLLLPVLPPPPAFANGDPDEVVERRPSPPYVPPQLPPPGPNGQRGTGGDESGEAVDESEWSELELFFNLLWSVFERTP